MLARKNGVHSLGTKKNDFPSLSVRDLVEARELYHAHLTHLDGVVATAIGKYRIRKKDDNARDAFKQRSRSRAPERTLSNSTVMPWSWPAVLVFVNHWKTQEEMHADPDQVVPRYLYMPDGRVIPTCVIKVEEETGPSFEPLFRDIHLPTSTIGGGYALVNKRQNENRAGSIGCLVTDGESVFVLTNRHVAGEPKSAVCTIVDGQLIDIGESAGSQVGKLSLHEAYPDWTATRTFVNVDAGLVKVRDVNSWTAQVYGIGEVGQLVDLTPLTLSLDMIGLPLKAFGAASGELQGEIQGFFYRYRSFGGFEYVADLLIGPREGSSLATLPGDSGTIWFVDEEHPEKGLRANRYQPIAMQWGGHVFADAARKSRYRFALATSLSTICRSLDVDIITDWNIGHNEYWGRVGHYKVAGTACTLLKDQTARDFFTQNLANIAFGDDEIRNGDLKRIDKSKFVPLADVSDFVWRMIGARVAEKPNHFADMDEKGKGEFKGKTLLSLCDDPKNVDVQVWNDFYDALGMTKSRKGALPFRVQELFDAMVGFAQEKDMARFLCAAGIMAHYVGDACQPLHVSFMHDGTPGVDEEKGVHSAYEEKMVNRYTLEIVDGVNKAIKKNKTKLSSVKSGRDAAIAVVELMKRTFDTLQPKTIVSAFANSSADLDVMWQKFGDRTVRCIADGSAVLAHLWNAAWKAGHGDKVPVSKIVEIERSALKKLYMNSSFLKSTYLEERAKAMTVKAAKTTAAKVPVKRTAKKSVRDKKGRRIEARR